MGRINQIDIMKGLLIISVVMGHCRSPFTKFISLFHMAVFFMVSGFLFQEYNSDSFINVARYVFRKIKTIWLPYFIWTVVFLICNNIFIKLHIYAPLDLSVNGLNYNAAPHLSFSELVQSILKGFIFAARTEMGGTFWFFRTLFSISILYVMIDYLIKVIKVNKKVRHSIHIILGVIMLALSFYCKQNNITLWGIPTVFETYLIYEVAFLFSKLDIMGKFKKMYIISFVAFLIILCCMNFGTISFGNNIYPNPLYLIVVTLSGWFLVYGISSFLVRFSWSKFIIYIGQNSLSIMILHFLCFKIVTLFQIYLYGNSIDYLAAFPVLYSNHFWWLAYLGVGVLIPLAINHCYVNIKQMLRDLQKNKNSRNTL